MKNQSNQSPAQILNSIHALILIAATMKQSSKPISSPSRSELFPPPLMSFIRADAGNRSKIGRTRSSPIFVREKNAAIETLEPSSPKVTCMGQVRASKTPAAATAARCRWIRSVPRRCRFHCHCRTLWNRSAALFRRKREMKRKSSISDSEEEEEKDGVVDPVFESSIVTPPKNALILTRCRSAPYRPMSYGNRNRSSSITGDEEQETENRNRSDRLRKNLENSIGNGDSKSDMENSRMNPKLILRRSRSEPGRIAEKLFRDLNLVEEERSVMASNDSCSLNNFRLDD